MYSVLSRVCRSVLDRFAFLYDVKRGSVLYAPCRYGFTARNADSYLAHPAAQSPRTPLLPRTFTAAVYMRKQAIVAWYPAGRKPLGEVTQLTGYGRTRPYHPPRRTLGGMRLHERRLAPLSSPCQPLCSLTSPSRVDCAAHPLCLCATHARRARVPLRRTAAVSAPPVARVARHRATVATSSTCFIDIPQSPTVRHPLCLCATRALSRRARVPLRRTAAVSAPPGCPRGTSPRNGLPRRRPASARGAKAIMGAFWLAMTHERWRAETTCLSPRVVPLTSLPWARALARAAALPPMPRRCSQRGCLALAFHGALTTRGACGQYMPWLGSSLAIAICPFLHFSLPGSTVPWYHDSACLGRRCPD